MDCPASLTQKLPIEEVFERLSQKEKHFVHYLSRAAWHGARIVLKQVSPEAEEIFDLIIELYKSCSGRWHMLCKRCGISSDETKALVEYSALFLANLGNYYVSTGSVAPVYPSFYFELTMGDNLGRRRPKIRTVNFRKSVGKS